MGELQYSNVSYRFLFHGSLAIRLEGVSSLLALIVSAITEVVTSLVRVEIIKSKCVASSFAPWSIAMLYPTPLYHCFFPTFPFQSET
jgi:hypothetical protein